MCRLLCVLLLQQGAAVSRRAVSHGTGFSSHVRLCERRAAADTHVLGCVLLLPQAAAGSRRAVSTLHVLLSCCC
jgi:hypothetical protein